MRWNDFECNSPRLRNGLVIVIQRVNKAAFLPCEVQISGYIFTSCNAASCFVQYTRCVYSGGMCVCVHGWFLCLWSLKLEKENLSRMFVEILNVFSTIFSINIQTVSRDQKENPTGVHTSSSSPSSSAQLLTHTHCLVLDISSVNFVDSVAMTAFCKVRKKRAVWSAMCKLIFTLIFILLSLFCCLALIILVILH